MNSTAELVDLKTLLALREAAPQVMPVPWDVARDVVKGLAEQAQKTRPHKDQGGNIYWQASLKEIRDAGQMGEDTSMSSIGRACRTMGLTAWREANGYHVAWSGKQLDILMKYFKV